MSKSLTLLIACPDSGSAVRGRGRDWRSGRRSQVLAPSSASCTSAMSAARKQAPKHRSGPERQRGVSPLAKCGEGDAATAISILERKLVNAGFTLPPRG